MVVAKPKLVAAVIGAVALAAGGAAFVALQKPGDHAQTAGPAGPGGAPGGQRGPGGPGGPGGAGRTTDVVAVATASRPFAPRIEALGTLEPRERVVLTANAADRVTGVFFEDGQRVKRGKTLVTLVNEQELGELQSAEAALANANLVYERNQRLSANDAIAQLELERSKSTADSAAGAVAAIQARLRDRVLVAPFDGILGFRQVSNGAYVSPGEAVATLIDDSEMRLEFGVPSIHVTDLKPGLAIQATSSDLVGRTFEGKLTSVDNAIDPVSRSVKVRATLPNRDGALKAGMFMTVTLASQPRTSLAVPEISVIAEGPETFVYVVDETRQPAVAVKTKIMVGLRERGVVEVLSGLSSGDLVVSDGVLKLRPNAPVRVQSKSPMATDSENGPRLAAGEAPTDKAGLRQ
jgi:membrane fusion protein (multidrug efflux system)